MITTVLTKNGIKVDILSYGLWGSISKEWYARCFDDRDYCIDIYEKSFTALCRALNVTPYKLKHGAIRQDFI